MENFFILRVMQNTDYKFIQVPMILGLLLDSYCLTVLTKLMALRQINQSDRLTVNNQNLQVITGLSKKVINATLSSLHRNGIVTVDCVGIGVSKTSNTITINIDKINEYDSIGVAQALTDDSLKITIDKYDVKGYRVSYLPSEEPTKAVEEVKIEIPVMEKKAETTDTDTTEILSDYTTDSTLNVIFCDDDDDDQEEETPPENYLLKPLSPLSAETATVGEIIEDARNRGINVSAKRDSDINGFRYSNVLQLKEMRKYYGYIGAETLRDMFVYCKENKI